MNKQLSHMSCDARDLYGCLERKGGVNEKERGAGTRLKKDKFYEYSYHMSNSFYTRNKQKRAVTRG